jgi:hypothetical protein
VFPAHAHGLGFGALVPLAGPWTPPHLGAAVLAYFEPSVLLADPVDSWQDQALVPHDAVQPVVARRPVLDDINGNTSVLFDGVDDFLGNLVSLPVTTGKFTVALGYQFASLPVGTSATIATFLTSLGAVDVRMVDLGGHRRLTVSVGGAAGVGVDAGFDLNPHWLVIRYLGGAVSNPANWAVDLDGLALTPVASGALVVGAATTLGAGAGGSNPAMAEMVAAVLINGSTGAPIVALLNSWLETLLLPQPEPPDAILLENGGGLLLEDATYLLLE